MARYVRAYVDGATYFFTVNLADRRRRLLIEHLDVLRAAFAETKALLPFHMDAIVVLPEHLHCMWTLPDADTNFSGRWRRIKGTFSKGLPDGADIDAVQARKGGRGIWQPRFREHVIRNERDYTAHFDYIHYNPVKHGHARHAVDWPYSSFHRCVRAGLYPANWGDDRELGGSYGEAE